MPLRKCGLELATLFLLPWTLRYLVGCIVLHYVMRCQLLPPNFHIFLIIPSTVVCLMNCQLTDNLFTLPGAQKYAFHVARRTPIHLSKPWICVTISGKSFVMSFHRFLGKCFLPLYCLYTFSISMSAQMIFLFYVHITPFLIDCEVCLFVCLCIHSFTPLIFRAY